MGRPLTFQTIGLYSGTPKWLAALWILGAAAGTAWAQKVEIVPADPVFLPGAADSNSPSFWADGKRYQFNSDGVPVRSEGDLPSENSTG